MSSEKNHAQDVSDQLDDDSLESVAGGKGDFARQPITIQPIGEPIISPLPVPIEPGDECVILPIGPVTELGS